MIKIENAIIYDPINEKNGTNDNIWIKDNKIVSPPSQGKVAEMKKKGQLTTIDASGKMVMPGGIDIHSHIAGPKVNSGRVLRPEDHRGDTIPRRNQLRSGVGKTVPSSFVIGYRYADMGYTTVMEAAGPPLKSRHIHEEFADLPFIDKGILVLSGNNYFVMKYIKENDYQSLKDYLAWLIDVTGGYGLKLVNPGGVEAWKEGNELIGIDTRGTSFGISPAEIMENLARASEELGLPHPVHIHTNNLGHPGNYQTTKNIINLLKDYRAHITHIQFSSYGSNQDDPIKFRSESGEIASLIDNTEGITVDIGQIVFGDVTTMTADGILEYNLHKLSGNKWVNTDVEMETGSGIVPMNYSSNNTVNTIQWATGMELFLKIKNPWKVFLTTDHPNAGPFTAYPHIIKLLMDNDFRQQLIEEMPDKMKDYTDIANLNREYSLFEIATITRAGQARALGLDKKGHLGPGADADITIYPGLEQVDDIEKVFANPEYVIKDGEIVVRNSEIIERLVPGKTLMTKPDYDKDIVNKMRGDFQKYYSISIDNYPVTDKYLKNFEVIPCR